MPGATPTKPGSATLPFFGIDLALLDGAGNVSLWVDGVLLASSWVHCFLEWDWMICSFVPSTYLSPPFPLKNGSHFITGAQGVLRRVDSHEGRICLRWLLCVRACMLGGVRVACVGRAYTARVCLRLSSVYLCLHAFLCACLFATAGGAWE
jgi:hypothetical protein